MNKFQLYRIVNRILIFIVFFLVLLISLGTLLAFFKPKTTVPIEKHDEYSAYTLRGDKAIYSDLKQLRIISKDEIPATIVISPHLEYDAKDIPLQEELVKKKEKLKECILQWFSKKTWLNIEGQKEEEIKKELLNEINKQLSLGHCSAIYFQEFKVLH